MHRPASIPHAVRSRHLARILPCLAGCLAAMLVTVDTAEAGRFGGGFRSSGSASRAATMGSRPSVQSAASAAASRSTPAAPSSPRAATPSSAASTSSASRPTAAPPSPAAPRVGAPSSSSSTSAKSAPRTPNKSLLDQAPPPPSQHLTQVIRERERSSGMGWFLGGMAFYSILHSDNNLSAADRSWIEDRIEEEKQQGTASPAPAAQPEPAPEPEKAPAPGPATALTFAYDVPARFIAGEAYRFTVKASDRLGAQAPVTCELEGAQIGSVAGLAASVEWTPTAPGVQVITCSSLGTVDQRLFDIEKPKPNAQTRNDSRAI